MSRDSDWAVCLHRSLILSLIVFCRNFPDNTFAILLHFSSLKVELRSVSWLVGGGARPGKATTEIPAAEFTDYQCIHTVTDHQ